MIPPWAADQAAAETAAPASKLISGWNLLAQVVDRIAFLLYFLVTLIFMATYIGQATANLQTS